MPWAFKVERILRKEKVLVEIVRPKPASSSSAKLSAEELTDKQERVICILSATVKDHLIS